MRKNVENENMEKPSDHTISNRSGAGNPNSIRKQSRPLKVLKNLLDMARKTLHRISEWEKHQNVRVMPSINFLIIWMTYTAFTLFIGAQLFFRFSILIVFPYGCAIYLTTVGLFWAIWRYQRSE